MVSDSPDSYELQLARGIAELLHTLELGVYDPTEVYPRAGADQVRGIIVTGKVPTTFPDCIVIGVSPFTRVTRTSGYCAVQLYIRIEGPQQNAANVAAEILNEVEGRTHAYLNGLGISRIAFRSGAEMGQDPQFRGAFSLNLLFHGRKPIINRPQIGA